MMSDVQPEKEEKLEPVWCIAANVLHDRPVGPGGAEIRHGTKHFAPGAKVYIVDFYWGMGGEKVAVIGRHRQFHRFITLVMPSKWLANWRAELVYSPHIIREVVTRATYKPRSDTLLSWPLKEQENWASSDAARVNAEEIIASMKKWYESANAVQPPVTRLAVNKNEESDSQ